MCDVKSDDDYDGYISLKYLPIQLMFDVVYML